MGSMKIGIDLKGILQVPDATSVSFSLTYVDFTIECSPLGPNHGQWNESYHN
jgi:hypothetical protein